MNENIDVIRFSENHTCHVSATYSYARRALVALSRCLGSINAPAQLEALFDLLNGPDVSMNDIEAAVRAVVEAAVPEEGDPHPQRASTHVYIHMGSDVERYGSAMIWFETPGGVGVYIGVDESDCATFSQRIEVTVTFNRPSIWLRREIAAAIMPFYSRLALAHLAIADAYERYREVDAMHEEGSERYHAARKKPVAPLLGNEFRVYSND